MGKGFRMSSLELGAGTTNAICLSLTWVLESTPVELVTNSRRPLFHPPPQKGRMKCASNELCHQGLHLTLTLVGLSWSLTDLPPSAQGVA